MFHFKREGQSHTSFLLDADALGHPGVLEGWGGGGGGCATEGNRQSIVFTHTNELARKEQAALKPCSEGTLGWR